ncbi:MAG: ABC transporter ATP-binding protein [Anaerolineae bacterium]|jgi:ABC-type sugar transport system ATPase subunit|nr:ABC transporter ATP-binding protein [Anaerolineae bacterium]
MAQINLQNVNKSFGPGVPLAVNDLTLTIEDGEFLVLLGPSGCGKTTTLRMIAGLERQTTGDIRIGERVVNDLRPGDRDIAFVFQFYALYPHLSVRDNIAFPLKAQNLPTEEVNRRVMDVAERLRITHILKSNPGRLPGGEQQRVALGRAMVRQPQAFLMDEPLTNLDASLRADMRVELKHLQHTLGTTMVYVTHDQIEAMSMSHRIAVMDRGVLQQVDTPLNIYRHPQTLFVATFIGSPPMNIVHGRMVGARFVAGDGQFWVELPPAARQYTQHDKRVSFGIRAEDITVGAPGGAGMAGNVVVREPLGDETVYVVSVAGKTLTAKTPPRIRFNPGENVSVKLDPAAIHLFDGDSGRALLPEGWSKHV